MSEKKVRIAFIGTGSMGQCAHLKNYASLPECEVVALAELREELRQRVAVRYGIPRTYADHETLLKKEKVDGLVASQPFDRHGVLVPDLLQAGVPVFTEKPLAATLEVGRKIVKAVKESGTWHMVGYHKRSDPATQYAKVEIDRLKASGALGKMKYVRVLMPAGDWVAGGFADLIRGSDAGPTLQRDPPPSDLDGSGWMMYAEFVNYYIHQVNLMRYLLGEPYQVTYAEASGVLLAGRSESGIPCVIEMTPYRTTVDWQESALVCFEKGYVKLELPAPLAVNRPGRVEVFWDPGERAVPQTQVPQLPWVGAMRQQAVNFLRAIRGEIRPPCEAEEALADLEVARDYVRLRTGQ